MANLITAFDVFVKDLLRAKHDMADGLYNVYLTNTAPNKATHSSKSDIPEIAAGNGYTARGVQISLNGLVASGNTVEVTGQIDTQVQAVNGSIGPFRYVVCYRTDTAAEPLVGFWDYGESITLKDGEKLTLSLSQDKLLTAQILES